MIVSICAQELKKLESFINYNRRDKIKGGGRYRGNLLLKLK